MVLYNIYTIYTKNMGRSYMAHNKHYFIVVIAVRSRKVSKEDKKLLI